VQRWITLGRRGALEGSGCPKLQAVRAGLPRPRSWDRSLTADLYRGARKKPAGIEACT
jgi:hypothetical protein